MEEEKIDIIECQLEEENRVEIQPVEKTEHKEELQLEPKIEHQVNKIEVEFTYHDYDTLVLAGGSAKSIVTLGAVQYVYDNYLYRNLKYYIGTSAGAIICYLLIIGYTPIEIMVYICTNQILEKMQHFNVFSLIKGQGACSFHIIQEELEKMKNKEKLFNYSATEAVKECPPNGFSLTTFKFNRMISF